eukprot:927609-Karenia_brevis.AAC.1
MALETGLRRSRMESGLRLNRAPGAGHNKLRGRDRLQAAWDLGLRVSLGTDQIALKIIGIDRQRESNNPKHHQSHIR